MNKLEILKKILVKMDSVLIAYSGGVDSTFLLKVANDVLKEKVLAVTANSPTYPRQELKFSKETAKLIGAKHRVIRTSELKDKKFISNPLNRCYYCKKELFSRLKKIAKEFKINFVADASTLSDKKDFRPGSKAKVELGIRSPLIEAGLKKEEIRDLSKKIGLVSWNKPSLACLASRLPYGVMITQLALKRINKAEEELRKLGFNQVRVRHYDSLARIEVNQSKIPLIIRKKDLVIEKLKKSGYNYITIDLEGYRTGSMNPAPSSRSKPGLLKA